MLVRLGLPGLFAVLGHYFEDFTAASQGHHTLARLGQHRQLARLDNLPVNLPYVCRTCRLHQPERGLPAAAGAHQLLGQLSDLLRCAPPGCRAAWLHFELLTA